MARRAGFREVSFVYEPIAAAYHYETGIDTEEIVLVADIGGGTSDFSLVRVGPERRRRADRLDDILANEGVRVGGTDFDRLLSLDRIMPLLGLGSFLVEKNLPMPRGLYTELATWATINFAYTPATVREVAELHRLAAQPEKVARLLTTVRQRLGHAIAMAVEAGKIGLSEADRMVIPLDFVEPDLIATMTRTRFDTAIAAETARLHASVGACLRTAGLAPGSVGTIFLTGGSSRVPAVRQAIRTALPTARLARGGDFVAVALGLTAEARRRYG